jgi:UDP-N-acetyl-D-mannosaminuronic acid dehydrogenase
MKPQLASLIKERGQIRNIGVVGMGYVGIPSAVLFAHSPDYKHVYGFQRESRLSGYKIGMLNGGESPIKGEEPDLSRLLKEVVSKGKFSCTSDFSNIAGLDAVTVAIQSPFINKDDLIPDSSALKNGISQIGRYLTSGTLVVIESTVTPGTTGGVVREILERESGLVAGKDFALAHAPERVMPGRLIKNMRELDRVVGGIDEVSTRRAIELYTPIITTGKIIVTNALTAEVTKTAENTFRDLQIAAVNELALYCEAIGVNVYEVRTGINSLKGDGVTRAILYPGAGVGGHCLTKDTYHLERGALLGKTALDYPKETPSLYTLARKINDFMPNHMFSLIMYGLMRVNKMVKHSKVALLGWSFLANSDDSRNTPSEQFYTYLEAGGAVVKVHDPYTTENSKITISRNLDEVIDGADVIVIFTAHNEYKTLDPVKLHMQMGKDHPVIIDGRNVIDPDKFIETGFVYKGIGRGDKNNHPIVEVKQ